MIQSKCHYCKYPYDECNCMITRVDDIIDDTIKIKIYRNYYTPDGVIYEKCLGVELIKLKR